MYWYKIYTRDRSKCLGGLSADSPEKAVQRWYKAGQSRWTLVVAEVYGYADKNKRGIEVYGS